MLFRLLVTIVFVPKDVVDVKNVIAILIVIAIVLDAFAGFSEHTTGVPGRLVFECRVTYSIG